MPETIADPPDPPCFHLNSKMGLRNFNHLALIPLGLARDARDLAVH
jgi:hypothetical protein